MSNNERSLVESSLIDAMGKARLPSMVGVFAAIAIVGSLTEWPVGWLPLVVAGIGAAHAIYEHFHPSVSRTIGLAIDTLVIIFMSWFISVPSVIVGYGMMLVVFAAFFTEGRRRTGLFVVISAAVGLALKVEISIQVLEPGARALVSTLLPFHAVVVVISVLSIAHAELRRSEVQRSYAVGTVAHELRNDLTPVIGLSSILLDELTAMGRADLGEMAGIIAAQALNASDTVDDLLTMARIDRAALGLTLGPIDLGEAVAEVVERYELHRVTGLTPSRRVEALGDPVRVRQIIRNLCTNAERYGGDRVEVAVELGDDGVSHVLVRDDGGGIEADEVVTIFEPFGRGALGRSNQSSVGLGLWLSRELARAMDGELSYHRHDGWTVFDLTLPSRPAPHQCVA